MNYLIISTIPHFYSILPLVKYYKKETFGYINIIIGSSTLSILYHLYNESNGLITTVDYSFAFIWFLYDIYMGYIYAFKYLPNIVVSNAILCIINIGIPYNNYYILYHSIWHLMNAGKCFYVAELLAKQLASLTRFVVPNRCFAPIYGIT